MLLILKSLVVRCMPRYAIRACERHLHSVRPHTLLHAIYRAAWPTSYVLCICLLQLRYTKHIMSSSGESSPVPSPEPENVACYEECITDEIFIPPSPAGDAASEIQPAGVGHQHGIPKASTSGRVTKRGNLGKNKTYMASSLLATHC